MTDHTTPQDIEEPRATPMALALLDGEWISEDGYEFYDEDSDQYYLAVQDDLEDLEDRLEGNENDAYFAWLHECGLIALG